MGWELRFFFSDSPENFTVVREKLFDVLNLPQNIASSQFEKRTDCYLQLNKPEIGFKFRGALTNSAGTLEYKVRIKGESPNAENWSKYNSGPASLKDTDKLKNLISSVNLPVSLDQCLQNFDTDTDSIHCEKERFNRIISSSNIQNEKLENVGLALPSFRGVAFEFAQFKLIRNSGEYLGEFFSFNFEGSTDQKLQELSTVLMNYLDYQLPVYSMGYPEFIMKVSNGDIP